jgi:lipoate-protein ligase A
MSDFRVIDLEIHEAAMNMALDEACMEAVRDRDVLPTIRFYRWQPSAVSIGYFQGLEEEIATEKCADAGVDIVRRRTGGGAVYHDFDGEITYSVIAPATSFPKGIIDSYKIICGWIIGSLERLGVRAEFKPINDIVIGEGVSSPDGQILSGKKISGNAQTRRGGVLLQHGTILYTVDVGKMFSLLKVGQEKIADKLIAAVSERVTSLSVVKPDLSIEDVYEALFEGFTEGKKIEKGEWTVAELQRANDLLTERYKSDEWNKMR